MSKLATKQTCTCCGKTKAKQTNFYISQSNLFTHNDGRLTICKDCVILKYDELVSIYSNEKKALYHLCNMLDVYFNNELCESAFVQSANAGSRNLAKIYFQKINSLFQYKGKTSLNSELFKEDKMDNDVLDGELEELDVDDTNNIKVNSEIIRRWGNGLTASDYVFLETNYQEFIDSYSHEQPAERLLLRQLSKVLLEGEHCRKKNDINGFEKMNKLVSQMLSDANIKPSQKRTFGEKDGETFGTFIRDIEMNEPIPAPLEQFKDSDKIEKMIIKYFINPMAKVFDLKGLEDEKEGGENDNSK